ncbi:MAG: DUF4349 domain-containing protein [Actinobacteria bacterium]|nr:DUF4349 domain-containing protein [Actinomycetota bacterium]
MRKIAIYLIVALISVFVFVVLQDVFINLDIISDGSGIDYPVEKTMDYGSRTSSVPSKGVEVSTGQKAVSDSVLGQKVIKTGYLEILNSEVKKATSEIIQTAKSFGSTVVSEQITGGDYPNAVVTLAVPEEKYESLVDNLRKRYEFITYNLTKQDVTEEFLDLEAELKVAKEELQAVESLLSKAKDVNEILKIRDRSRSLRKEVAQLEKRLKEIEERVELSLLTVVIQSPELVKGERNWWSRTLKELILVLQRSTRKTLAVMVALIPIAGVLLVTYGLYFLVRRLFKRSG